VTSPHRPAADAPPPLRFARLRRALLRHPFAAGLAIGLAVFAAVVAARAAGALVSLELSVFDRAIQLRPLDTASPKRVALVAIREEDFRRFGYPIPDPELARLLRTLGAAGPRAIGVDLYRDLPVCGATGALEAALTDDSRIVVIEKLPGDGDPGTPPPPVLRTRPDQVGFSDLPRDAEGVVRRALLYAWPDDGDAHLSLSYQLALRWLAGAGVTPIPDPSDPSGERIQLGRLALRPFHRDDGGYVAADDGDYQSLLDFARGPGAFPVYGMAAVLDGGVPTDALRDHVVIVGTTAASVRDFFRTPWSRGLASLDARPPMFGMELHAHAVDQLLRGAIDGAPPLRTAGERVELGAILLFALAGGLAGFRVRALPSLVLAFTFLLVLGLGGGALALFRGLWLPSVAPTLAGTSALVASVGFVVSQQRAERALLRKLFEVHVSPPVLAEILRQRDAYLESGRPRPEARVLTVLMSDLKGFTSASESLEPTTAMDWINAYMDAMATLVLRHGGMVDDYWGDGIKANFGIPRAADRDTPEEHARDARRAAACALEMGEAMAALNQRWSERGLPTGRVRIGLHTGPAVVGSLGSDERLKYTSVGDTVNTAARLEGLDKEEFEREESQVRILASGETVSRLGDEFVVRSVGRHALRGKAEPIEVWRIEGRRGDAQPASKEDVGR